MKFSLIWPALALIFLSCKTIHDHDSGLESSVSPLDQSVRLPAEPYPFNRLPVSQLKATEAATFKGALPPPIIEVKHSQPLEPHGIRYIQTQRDIAKYVRPGDIFVSFDPMIKDTKDPMMLLQQGMYHAGLVVANHQGGKDLFFPGTNNDSFLCHFDTTAGYDPSGCTFDGPHHFFRINHTSQSEKKVIDIANQIFGNWGYDYLFQLNAESESTIFDLKHQLSQRKKMSFYCSELPYTIHALALEHMPFKPTSIGSILNNFNSFRDKNRNSYQLDLSDASTTKAIIEYFASFLPERSQTIIDNAVIRSYVRSAISKPLGKTEHEGLVAKRVIVPPWQFMEEAKKNNPSISYIGTYYPGEHKAIAIPINAMAQLKTLHKILLINDKQISEARSLLPPTERSVPAPIEVAGTRSKLGRLVQYIKTRPYNAPHDQSIDEIEKAREESHAKIESKLITAQSFKNLNYTTYLEICDELLSATDLNRVARTHILKALSKTRAPQNQQELIKKTGTLNDATMQLAWEDFGCGMAAKYEIQSPIPNQEILKSMTEI